MSIERRITTQLMEYWVRLKGDNELPLERDIKQQDLEDIWTSCFQVELVDMANSCQYNYSFLGEEIKKAYGCDLSKEEESPMVSTVAHKLDAQFKGAMNSRMPMEIEGEFVNAHGKRVAFRQCLLPFSVDGINSHCIFGGMRYRIYEE